MNLFTPRLVAQGFSWKAEVTLQPWPGDTGDRGTGGSVQGAQALAPSWHHLHPGRGAGWPWGRAGTEEEDDAVVPGCDEPCRAMPSHTKPCQAVPSRAALVSQGLLWRFTLARKWFIFLVRKFTWVSWYIYLFWRRLWKHSRDVG